jgi:hypothetical protein
MEKLVARSSNILLRTRLDSSTVWRHTGHTPSAEIERRMQREQKLCAHSVNMTAALKNSLQMGQRSCWSRSDK